MKTLGVFALILTTVVGVKAQTITDGSFLSDVTISAASNTTNGGVQHSGTVVADFDGDASRLQVCLKGLTAVAIESLSFCQKINKRL